MSELDTRLWEEEPRPNAHRPPPPKDYPPPSNGYPPPSNGYPPTPNGYPPNGYPPPSNGYPPAPNGYPPPSKDYRPDWAEPPEMGWQGLAYRAGMRNVRPGERERLHRARLRFIRRRMRSPKIIAVFSPKGGVGKSTTAIMLGQVLAQVRGDLIAALDANPDSGNLVKRLRQPYSPHTADDLGRDIAQLSRYTDLLPYLTKDDSGLCVIRSATDSSQRLGPDEYRTILGLLTRFYGITIVDLGTGIREPGFLSIVDAADALVAVTEPSLDATEVAIGGIDWLRRQFPAKIGGGTLVLNATEPRYTQIDVTRLAAEFSQHMVRVLQVPRDPHLATGSAPRWQLLARQTRDAYLALAAAVIDGLPDED